MAETTTYRFVQMVRLPQEPRRKFPRFEVRNVVSGALLGYVRYQGFFKEFVFDAQPGLSLSGDCLDAIADFVGKLNPVKGRGAASYRTGTTAEKLKTES